MLRFTSFALAASVVLAGFAVVAPARPSGTGGRPVSAAAGGALRHAVAAPGSPPRPDWGKSIGGYRLRHWTQTTPSGEVDEGQSLVIRDARGRQVVRVTGHFVELVRVAPLEGNGVPDVVVRADQLGAHGPSFFYIFSLGRRPRCLLAYFKKNSEDEDDFALKDLDGDGRQEILTWYDGFAYWSGGRNEWQASYAGGARIPVVLGLQRGHYVEVTFRYRTWLRRRLGSALDGLEDELAARPERRLVAEAAHRAIEVYAIERLRSGPQVALRTLAARVPLSDFQQLRAMQPKMERVLRKRFQRCAHPPVYRDDARYRSGVWLRALQREAASS